MQKSYTNKAVRAPEAKLKEFKEEFKVEVEVDSMAMACEKISSLGANDYAKARHAYLGDIKKNAPESLARAMKLLPK